MSDPKMGALELGPGLFVRQLSHLSPDQASKLGHVAIPVTARGRAINRRRAWYAAARTRFICWSWFTVSPDEIREAVAFAASVGSVAFVINGEKELRGQPLIAERLAQVARRECDRHGLQLGLVSYSIPRTVRDFPWSVFRRYCDFGMPEIYDREGRYDAAYPGKAIRSWRDDAGFRTILPACGVYQRQDSGKGWRYRRPKEIERHLSLFPADVHSVTGWSLGGRSGIPAGVVSAMAAWRAEPVDVELVVLKRALRHAVSAYAGECDLRVVTLRDAADRLLVALGE